MDAGDWPQHHRTTSTAGELFICFTSRPSASSSSAPAAMRVPSSKPLMSPARAQNPTAPSLSASLSRRLRSSGSVKGGQSPMFPAGVVPRKKGCAFEAAEPSSPKVTCIGQVRVKSKKKKGKNGVGVVVRSRSQRRSGGEASFRRSVAGEGEACGERECKRWALAVCEAIRTLGSELNCFVPCKGGRSICASSSASREEEEESNGGAEKRTRSSCRAVLARWLMAIHETEEGKRGEVVGLMVENEEGREVEEEDVEQLVVVETKNEEVEVVAKEEEAAGDEGRVSMCIPPKNALLLMRCRSDPVRMAALATRFWGSPAAAKVGVMETAEEEEDEDEEEAKDGGLEKEAGGGEGVVEVETEEVKDLSSNNSHGGADLDACAEKKEEKIEDLKAEEEDRQQEAIAGEVEESKDQTFSAEVLVTPAKEADHNSEEKETPKEHEREQVKQKEQVKVSRSGGLLERRSKAKEREMRRSRSSKEKDRRRNSFSVEREARRHSFSAERDAKRASFSVDPETKSRWSFSIVREEDKPTAQEERRSKKEAPTEREQASKATEPDKEEEEEEEEGEVKVKLKESNREEKKEEKGELPDCLLLMMYEPKLSMEVSKETWVCSNDFFQWRNHHHRYAPRPGAPPPPPPPRNNASEGSDSKLGETKGFIPAADATVHPLPPVLPAPALSKEVERKLFGATALAAPAAAVAYEPFVLTRCKSEPMRSSARLEPDACFWKSRHQPIGAAGIGF